MHKNIQFYPYHIPDSFSERLLEAKSSGFSGVTERLESDFSKKFGCEYVLSTCNSSAALHLAMCALDLKRGDKVVCPVNAFVDIPEVVRHFDAEPIFVDCDRRSYNMDPDRLEDVLSKHKTKKLRAVIVNHMAGLPADMDRICELTEKYDVKLIEDCSDAPDIDIDVKNSSTMMRILAFGSKIANTYDGGVLLSYREELHNRALSLRDHAVIRSSEELNYLYDVVDIGCQYRMSEYDAVYALALLDEMKRNRSRRREIAEIYFEKLDGLKHVKLPLSSEEHSYFYFIVEIDKNRDAFARQLKKLGIESSLHYIPVHSMRYYKDKYALKIFDFPEAMSAYQSVMSLPNSPTLTDEDILYICESIRRIDSMHV